MDVNLDLQGVIGEFLRKNPKVRLNITVGSPNRLNTRAGRRPLLIARSFIKELVARLWQQSHLVEAYKGDELFKTSLKTSPTPED